SSTLDERLGAQHQRLRLGVRQLAARQDDRPMAPPGRLPPARQADRSRGVHHRTLFRPGFHLELGQRQLCQRRSVAGWRSLGHPAGLRELPGTVSQLFQLCGEGNQLAIYADATNKWVSVDLPGHFSEFAGEWYGTLRADSTYISYWATFYVCETC